MRAWWMAVPGAAAVAWLLLPPAVAPAPAEAAPAVVAAPSPAAPAAGVVEPPIPLQARTPAEVRQVVWRCRAATNADRVWLRQLALTAADPLVAGNAVAALGRLYAVAADQDLLALLGDPRPRLRQELVVALGRSPAPEATTWLQRALLDTDVNVRRLAQQELERRLADGGRQR